MTTSMITAAASNDAELVNGTLAGNRDAFSQIVSRYQSLICSLTYSATGNLGQSEDLAQETFITAWKHLRQLRERDKLRSWLCGIARNRINNFLRREGREPLHQAGPLDEASETHSPEPLPVEYTISNEEQAILWRSLERIPEIYREPLVLFYREHQSIEAVAEKLESTEDTVKQRLSRGRKIAARAGPRLRRRRAGADESGKSFYARRFGRAACAHDFRQGRDDWRSSRERRRGGKNGGRDGFVRRDFKPAARLHRPLRQLSHGPR